ncbi:MAG: lysophospholipid acyltransferase family protein [Burkholderiales bacterium]
MKLITASLKLARALAHIVAGLWTIHTRFATLPQAEKEVLVTAWSRTMLDKIGIELRVLGQPAISGPMLLVANHISWLDITSMHAARYCHFVSKASIKQWPIIGTLSDATGTLYVERENRRDALRVVHRMADALREAQVVAVFPEGTTSNGEGLLPFHPNVLQAAIAADAPLQTVALSYLDRASGQRTQAASFIGDQTLVGSIWRVFTAPPLTVVLDYGIPQHANGRDRRTWAQDAQADIARRRN